MDKFKILEILKNEQLTNYHDHGSEIILEFGDKVLVVSGTYTKNVYTELKRKVISYESL
ncbi:hypothetical protein Elgi_38550 [Paenibacillus elgii]|uniref:hypothetical protein n=1 Tax=Paenibacillus elgii TaxID=189691 RepID=UPI002D7CFF79|nr:hypothetical protein Elgi_38550 [Paenibacillus elgii]